MLSQQSDYKIKKQILNSVILRLNKDRSIEYNQQILAAIFHIENNTFKKKIIKEIKKNKII